MVMSECARKNKLPRISWRWNLCSPPPSWLCTHVQYTCTSECSLTCKFSLILPGFGCFCTIRCQEMLFTQTHGAPEPCRLILFKGTEFVLRFCFCLNCGGGEPSLVYAVQSFRKNSWGNMSFLGSFSFIGSKSVNWVTGALFLGRQHIFLNWHFWMLRTNKICCGLRVHSEATVIIFKSSQVLQAWWRNLQ